MHAAIVTGISRGLGAALAAVLIARGYRVIGIGRTGNAALAGEQFHRVDCDLGAPARIAAIVGPALGALAAAKPATVTLINNAAVAWPVGRIGHLDDGEAETGLA